MDSRLIFQQHISISNVVSRSDKMAGFVVRQSKNFAELSVFVLLYTSQVRLLLQNNTIIWCPHLLGSTKSTKEFYMLQIEYYL